MSSSTQFLCQDSPTYLDRPGISIKVQPKVGEIDGAIDRRFKWTLKLNVARGSSNMLSRQKCFHIEFSSAETPTCSIRKANKVD
jgi:hypothetical protein